MKVNRLKVQVTMVSETTALAEGLFCINTAGSAAVTVGETALMDKNKQGQTAPHEYAEVDSSTCGAPRCLKEWGPQAGC